MRVPTITIYKQATYQLNRLSTNVNEANAHSITRINSASDDPSGMAQLLDINSSLSCQEQYQVNIGQGQNVLTDAETALDAMADQLLELNHKCEQWANASYTNQERTDASRSMQIYLDQLVDLANTQSYGGYIFAGDQNQAPPFNVDDPDNSTRVTYVGSDDPARIKTGQDRALSIDCCGSDLFYEDKILVDENNNSILFQEDPGTGTQNILTIDTIVPSGSYSREELAHLVETTMTQASLEKGYGIGYEVTYDGTANAFSVGTDGKSDPGMKTSLTAVQENTTRISGLSVNGEFPDMEIELITPGKLTEYTPEPEGSAPLTLTYTADGTWEVENNPGYVLPAEIPGNGQTLELDTDEDGVADIRLDLNAQPVAGTRVSFDIVRGFENNSILQDLGFDGEATPIEPATSQVPVADTFTVISGKNDTIDFTETLKGEEGGAQLTAVIKPGSYSDPQSYAMAVEEALETASAQNGNRVNYQVSYDEDNQSFTLREDVNTGRQLESFDLLFSSGTHNKASAATDLGFLPRDIHSGPVQGETATWSIFDTVFDLKAALAENDVDGIQRAMIRFENHYESITSSISSVGTAYAGLTATQSTAVTAESSLKIQRSDVEDADTVEAIMNLETAQTVYEAALKSTSKVIGMSLMDYM